jgi:hypothetical protein
MPAIFSLLACPVAGQPLLCLWASNVQKPDAKGKQPATPAGEAEQHYAKQYVLLQLLRYGRRSEFYQLLPLPDDCVTCGKRQHGVVTDALTQLLERYFK